jgi:hypothetical protein
VFADHELSLTFGYRDVGKLFQTNASVAAQERTPRERTYFDEARLMVSD